jgi:SAM-dependent methyltransferase
VLSVKGALNNVHLYVALQRALGADRLRTRSLERAAIRPGDTVLDIGCGPAYYLDQLHGPVVYHGFDTDAGYIEWARKRWGADATFHNGIFDEVSAASLPQFDVVLMLGLLHHVSDAHAADLMDLCARKLKPGGRLISVDTCYVPTQGRLSRWISDNDRGEFVRSPEEFTRLAAARFDQIEGAILDRTMRVPSAFWMMRCSTVAADQVAG